MSRPTPQQIAEARQIILNGEAVRYGSDTCIERDEIDAIKVLLAATEPPLVHVSPKETRAKLRDQSSVEAVQEYTAILAFFERIREHGLPTPIRWSIVAGDLASIVANDNIDLARYVHVNEAVGACIMMKHHRVDFDIGPRGDIGISVSNTLLQRNRP